MYSPERTKMENSFLPGSLIEARDRIWVVQSGSTDDWLKLRPVGGADDEVTELSPKLEERFGPVKAAVYPLPNPETVGPLQSCTLLFNALRFQIRQGARTFPLLRQHRCRASFVPNDTASDGHENAHCPSSDRR